MFKSKYLLYVYRQFWAQNPNSLQSLGHEECLLVRLSAEEVDEHVHGVHGSAAGEDLGAVVLADGGVEETLPVR